MRPMRTFSGLSVLLLLAISLGCAAPVTEIAPTEPATPTSRPRPSATATATATATSTATATATPSATSSAGAPVLGPAGSLIPHTTVANLNPVLAHDGQGQLNLFFVAADPTTGGSAFKQTQLNADGAWTTPTVASPSFQFLSNLTAVPDTAGQLCILWSGEQYDAKGNAVYGLWRNCQQADGTWQTQAQPLAITPKPASFSPAHAKDGALLSVLITPAGSVEGLYFSPIGETVSAPLMGTLLSGAKQVLFGRLAIDADGGYHAAWVESSGNTDVVIQHRQSTDGGRTWSPAEQLYAGTADNPAEISFQLIAGAAGQVHLAWDADHAVYYRQWTAAGGWATPVTLSGKGRSAGLALAVTPAGLARAAWQTAGAQGGLLLSAQGADGGWSAPVIVSPSAVFDVALICDPSGVNQIVWRGDDGLRYLALR